MLGSTNSRERSVRQSTGKDHPALDEFVLRSNILRLGAGLAGMAERKAVAPVPM